MKGGCRYIGEGVGWFNHRGCRVGVVGESDGEPVRSLGPPCGSQLPGRLVLGDVYGRSVLLYHQ